MIRFGLIGTNFITDWFLEAAKECDDFELVAVYSRSMDKAKEYAKKQGAVLFFDNLEQLAECSEVDAVYIASPTSLHYSQTMMMLNHGKHVLCEKPICSNGTELKMMLEAAKSNQVILLEAMRPAFDPGTQWIQDNMHKIGPVRRATIQFCQYSSRYDKFKEGIIENAFNPKFSNGAIMDIGVYATYFMIRLFGRPDHILASGITLSNGVNGAGTILAQYDQMQAEVLFSKITDSVLPSQIQGEKGCMVIDTITAPEKITIQYRDGSKEEAVLEKKSNNMYYEIREFLDIIKTGKEVDTYHKQSTDEIYVLDTAREQMGIVFPADKIAEV